MPACLRVQALLKTLSIIQRCNPAPEEILVHADGGSSAILAAMTEHFPAVRVLVSDHLLGPGGARNRLIAAAQHELVANFDDDSFPDQPDYFARVLRLAREFPDAAMYSAASQDFEKAMPGPHAIAVSSGCGCVFRKSWHAKTRGFVSLPIAYGMEETDISLQLHALGGVIVHAPDLHVKHDKSPPVEVSAHLNAAVIANMALLPYLRYPVLMWPAGFWQVLRRVMYVINSGWCHGVWTGIQMIPGHLVAHRSEVARVSYRSLVSWFVLRLRPRPLSPLPVLSSPIACLFDTN
ncbi:MAG: hypothetical protein RIS79_3627 [Verrucomicrobiota bacterium]